MRRFLLVVGSVLAVALGVGAFSTARSGPPPGGFQPPAYVALGDSVAAGVGARPAAPGYPERVEVLLESGYHPRADRATPQAAREFDLVLLAEPGATTSSLAARQLPRALQLAREREANRDPFDDVEVLTLTIGGNDVVAPAIQACVLATDPSACQPAVEAALAAAQANLIDILGRLKLAVGPRAEAVVTTYYNPIASCFLAGLNPAAPAIADVVLEGGRHPGLLQLDDGLNDVIRETAVATGFQVAELYGVLQAPEDYVGGTDCLHPSAEGHATIARVVYATLVR
jgi:lysophospholipase L1-like esterase